MLTTPIPYALVKDRHQCPSPTSTACAPSWPSSIAAAFARRPTKHDMHVAPFGAPVRFMPVASPAYLAARGTPQTPDDLRQHQCIRMRMQSGKIYRWEFARHGQAFALDVPGALILNQVGLMAEAALAGRGIAYVPDTTVRDHLQEGRLVPLLQDWCQPSSELAMYYPGHRHVPAALRAFIEVLQEVYAPA
nr:LysR substrate-binding domain-containing protein [Massilia timonae]